MKEGSPSPDTIVFCTGGAHKQQTLAELLKALGFLLGVERVEPPDFEENHRQFNPEQFIKEKVIQTFVNMRREGGWPQVGKVVMIHDFMATGKVVGEEGSVFLNKPPQGEDPLEWFAKKMAELRRQAGGGVVELTFRNVVGLVVPDNLGKNGWHFRYDWHIETVRVGLSPAMAAWSSEIDNLRVWDEKYRFANGRSAGGVNVMTGLLPMIVEIASLQGNDGLSVVIEHKVAIPGESGIDGCLHQVDSPVDLQEKEMREFLRRYANGFSPEFVRGIVWRIERLEAGGGRRLVIKL